MALRDDAVIVGAVALAGWILWKKATNVFSTENVEKAITQYTSGIVKNNDGTINVPATIALSNPSGIPPATNSQVLAGKLAIITQTDIVYTNNEIDDTGTIAAIANKLNIPIQYHWYGAIDFDATAALIVQAVNLSFGVQQ